MNDTRIAITASELARIANRHSDIPQDALAVPEVPRKAEPEKVKEASPKSVRWERCPRHTPSGKKTLTGLVLAGDGGLVFREHRKSIGKFLVRCPGSGEEWTEVDA